MQKVKIITHSGSDLTFQEASALNITLLPDLVAFGMSSFETISTSFRRRFIPVWNKMMCFPPAHTPI